LLIVHKKRCLLARLSTTIADAAAQVSMLRLKSANVGGLMAAPDDKRKKNPPDRFRTIMSAEKDQPEVPEVRKPAVVNLPRLVSGTAGQGAAGSAPPEPSPVGPGSSRGGVLPAFWTVACLVSLAANAFLLLKLFGLTVTVQTAKDAGSNAQLLTGIYTSMDGMDKAHLKTSVPIRADLPLTSTIPVQAATKITLAQDAVIDGAHVKIETGAVNIDAPASVTLPAGTPLDVTFDFQVPLQTTIPLAMDVPVDIAVQDTGLHPAIQGLQQTVRPLLCSTSPQAVLPSGESICR
jgi:hypothetical protein